MLDCDFCARRFPINPTHTDREEGNVQEGGSPEVPEGHEYRRHSLVAGAFTDSRSCA